jgi:hypothetical protein
MPVPPMITRIQAGFDLIGQDLPGWCAKTRGSTP